MTRAAGFNERETELRRFAAWAAARRCWRVPRGGYLLLADFAPKQLARLKRAEKAPRLLEALQYGFETCYTLYRVSPSRPASGGGLNFELRRQESRFALKWGGRSSPQRPLRQLRYASEPVQGSLEQGAGLELEQAAERGRAPIGRRAPDAIDAKTRIAT